jgi:hypothetical protein
MINFALSFNAWADQQQDPALTTNMLNRFSLVSPQVLAKRHYWMEVGLQSDLGFYGAGLQTGIGYRLNYFGFDLRLSAGKTSYGMINSIVTYTQNSTNAQNAEVTILRSKSDSWNYWSIEPGLSISSRLFSGSLSQFTERVRVGFIYGNFKDSVNNIPFKSFILNAETSLIYQLIPNGPWSMCGSLSWNSGMLVRRYQDSLGDNQSYALPIGWIGSSLSMQYAF